MELMDDRLIHEVRQEASIGKSIMRSNRIIAGKHIDAYLDNEIVKENAQKAGVSSMITF